MSLGDPDITDMKDAESFYGPEDVVVKGKAPIFVVYAMIIKFRSVQHVVRPECLGFLLNSTVMQDIQHRLIPGLNPSSEFTLDATGLERVKKITCLTFAPGKTCSRNTRSPC